MEYQFLFNLVGGVATFFFGWWIKSLGETMKDLQDADKKLAEKVASIEVLVAGEYIRREDFDKMFDSISHKLDRIEDKLDAKADKERH